MDLFAFVKPKNELESPAEKQQNVPFVPEEMWIKCPNCNTMLLTTDMEENLHVCTHCDHHFRLSAKQRIALLADMHTFEERDAELTSENILDFPGYDEKLQKAKKKSNESVICGTCEISGIKTFLCVMDADFMMGSMGTVTGDKITRAFEYATEKRLPIVVCTVSGGARMNRTHRSHHRRRYRVVRYGGRHHPCRAKLTCGVRGAARYRADDAPKAPQGLPDLRVCFAKGLY